MGTESKSYAEIHSDRIRFGAAAAAADHACVVRHSVTLPPLAEFAQGTASSHLSKPLQPYST